MRGFVALFDPGLRLLALEGDEREALGSHAEPVLGQPLDKILRAPARAEWETRLGRALQGEESAFEWTAPAAGNRIFVRVVPLHGGDDSVQGALATGIDTNGEHRLEDEREPLATLRAVTASLPETAVTVFDQDLRVELAYGEALGLNGWTSEAMRGKFVHDLLPATHVELLEPLFRAALEGERSSAEVPSLYGDRTLLTYTAPVPVVDRVAGVAISVDITERKRAEDASRRLAAIVEQSNDAILAVDRDQVITAWNQGAERLFGHRAQQALGQPMAKVVPHDRLEEDQAIMRRVLGGDTVEYETERVRSDRTLVAVAVIASPISDATGAIIGASAITRDVTERNRLEQRLELLATRDPLTGLTNRRAFEEELVRAVQFVRRYGLQGALLLLDVDHFKYVNDTYGHAVGDATLRRVAELLRQRLRETDVIARLGGDEFAVILPGTPRRQTRALAQELLEILRKDTAVGTDDHVVRLTASIGIAPIEPGSRLAPDELLVHADIAMYEAKEAGRDRITETDFAGREPAFMSRLNWSERINRALEHDDFVLYHQPIVNLRNDAVEREELLIRMCGDHDELVAPASFLPVAERFGQIGAIDRWVIDRALEKLQALEKPPILHVNLSGVTMTDPDLIDKLPARIAREAADPSRLAFEITETAAIENVEEAQRLADQLSALGCQIVLDDFGSGFGSLYYLKHLPFDSLKIDGEFIKQITTGKADRVTVQAIVDMARGLGKTTIAECVEDEATLTLLRDLDVDYVQGYHLGRPAPASASG